MSAYAPPFYTHAMSDIPGVVAANYFMSVFNPLASGKAMIVFQVLVTPWAAAGTTADASLNIFRTTAASGGTLLAASAIHRFLTVSPDPVVEVRHDNPTVTAVSGTLVGFPPAITASGLGQTSPVTSTPPGAGFVCLPGEGVAMHTAAGDVDQRWNFGIVWAEAGL